MASKKASQDRGAWDNALISAQAARTEEPEAASNRVEAATKPVLIRLTESEYNRMKSLFAKEGVKLSSGVKTVALWAVEMIEAGAMRVTKAGIIDKRNMR